MNAPTLTLASVLPALPEIYLVAAICVVLLVDVFAGASARRVTPTLTLLVLAAGAGLTLAFAQVDARVELDQAKRAQMYARCQELIGQNSGMVCFAVEDYLDAHHMKLQGLTPSARLDMGDGRIAEKGWFS